MASLILLPVGLPSLPSICRAGREHGQTLNIYNSRLSLPCSFGNSEYTHNQWEMRLYTQSAFQTHTCSRKYREAPDLGEDANVLSLEYAHCAPVEVTPGSHSHG